MHRIEKYNGINSLTESIIGNAIKVHRKLGPGFLESVYQTALAYELEKAGIPFEKEKILPFPYENIVLEVGFRCDFLVDNKVIVECKSVSEIMPIDHAWLFNPKPKIAKNKQIKFEENQIDIFELCYFKRCWEGM